MVGLFLVSLTPTLPQDPPKQHPALAMGLFICFHRLLDEAFQETVTLGPCLQA